MKYPIATVLLDMTADESQVERVARAIRDQVVLDLCLHELEGCLRSDIEPSDP